MLWHHRGHNCHNISISKCIEACPVEAKRAQFLSRQCPYAATNATIYKTAGQAFTQQNKLGLNIVLFVSYTLLSIILANE